MMEQQQQPGRRNSAFQRLQAVFGSGKKAVATEPKAAASTAAQPVQITVVKGGVRVGGVSLRYLVDIANEYPNTTTVTAFVQQEIKPRTATKKEAYLDMLARENPNTVRPTAQYFVSYVWAYPLKEVVDALVHTLLTKTGENDVFVWMDAFCVNQHQVAGKNATPEELQETFGESLKAIGKMVMVLVNWKDPSYPKRIWCVFEAYMSKASETEVVLAMSPTEEKSLVEAMVENKVSGVFLNTLFGSVNVENAKATVAKDQETILRLIREFGVAAVNAVVLGNLKQWIALGGELALKGLDEDSLQACNVCMARYAVHDALGEYDAALEWVDKSLAIDIKVHGPEHSETATSLNNRADCLRSLGRFEEALPEYDKVEKILRRTMGDNHPNVAGTFNNRAECLRSLGRFDEALPLYDQVITIFTNMFGPDHPNVATCLNNRAGCLGSLERYEEALNTIDQALAIRAKSLGPDHPDTVISCAWKADILQAQDKFDDALVVLDEVLASMLRIYGENHPNTASAFNNRGGCLSSLGRFDEALIGHDQALAIDMKVYGPDHPNVARDLNNKAECLRDLGRFDEALLLYDQALAIGMKTLGPDHPQVVTVFNNRAECLRDVGRRQ